MRKNIESVGTGRARPGISSEAERIEAIARAAYDRCHPGDTFDDMKRRARFSREDSGLLSDWLAFAEREARMEDRRRMTRVGRPHRS